MTDVVRRVIIQTEIEAANAGMRGGGNADGSRPLGGSGSGPRSTAQSQSDMILRGQQQISRETAANIRMQVEQTLALRRAQEQAHRERLRMIKAEVEMRLQQRRQEAAAEKFRSGAGVNRGGQGANYFSTGFAPLDRVNQLGFQGFITAMTIRMAAQIGTGIVDNLQGWMTGRGESAFAGAHRFLKTGRPDSGGAIESFGIMGDRIASLWGGNAVFDPDLKGDQFMRRRFGMREGQFEGLSQRATQFGVLGGAQGELQKIIDLWDMVHGNARKAAEQELENAKKRLERAKEEFGMLGSFDRAQVVDIVKRFKAGGMVASEEMQMARPFLEGTPEFKKRQDELWRTEGQRLLAELPSLEGDVAKAQKEVDKLQPVITINGVTFNISAKMDEITEEMKQRLGDMMTEQLRLSPLFQEFENSKKGKAAPGGRGGGNLN